MNACVYRGWVWHDICGVRSHRFTRSYEIEIVYVAIKSIQKEKKIYIYMKESLPDIAVAQNVAE